MKQTTQGVRLPEAAIAVQNGPTKSVQRVINGRVYLNSGQEFLVMLFNPMSDRICAEIRFNGRESGDKLVLRPGERVWLDRLLSWPKKLTFETYTIDLGNPGAQEAIHLNGDIDVLFYREYHAPVIRPVFIEEPIIIRRPIYVDPMPPYVMPYWPQPWWNQPIVTCGGTTAGNLHLNTFTNGAQGQAGASGVQGVSGVNCMFNAASGELNMNSCHTSYSNAPQMETGRVEGGAKSEQQLHDVEFQHEPIHFHQLSYKLMPIGQINTRDQLRVPCGKCGRKRRRGELFCPKCGTKY